MPKRVKKRGNKKKKFIPGYGGAVGRGLGAFRKHFTSKGSTVNWLVGKVKKIADAVNIEYKEYEVKANPTPDYNGAIVNLCVPAQGTANSQRIGDGFKMQNLTFRGYVKAGPTLHESIRVLIFIDKQNQITTGADLLDNTGTGYATLSSKNEDNKYMSRVLYDRTFQVSPGYRPIIHFEGVIPIDLHQHFQAGTTTIKDNALKQMVISDLASGTASATVVWCSYVSYTDD